MTDKEQDFSLPFSIEEWKNWQEFMETYCAVCRYYDTEAYTCEALECVVER